MAKKSRFTATAAGENAPVTDGTIYRVKVEMTPHETVRNLGAFRLDFCCMPQERDAQGGRRRLHAYASGETVTALRAAGRQVEVLADAIEEGRRMQTLISRTDRFDGGRKGPEGVGKLI